MAATLSTTINTKLSRRKAEVVASLRVAQLRARTDPIWFAENVLRLRPLPTEATLKTNPDLSWEMDVWQREMLEAAADVYRKLIGQPTKINHEGKPYITVRAPHGPGKTFGAATLMHWFNFCFDGLVACTAPKLDQLKTRLWREFRKINARAVPQYSSIMHIDTTKITWGGTWIDDAGTVHGKEWYALAETASNPENLAGFHDQHICFIVEEASGVPEDLYPVVFSALSTGFMRLLLLIGNPTKRTGTFAASHLNADVSKDFYRLHISLDKTLRVKRTWVDQMIRQYGHDSPIVKVRCYGEFADASDYQLIPLDWIERARNRTFNRETGDGSHPKLRVSVDVADGGMDETVITIGFHYQSHILITRQYRYNFEPSKSPILAAQKAVELYDAWGGSGTNGDDIVIDGMGVGAGTAGYVMQVSEQRVAENREPILVVVYRGGESSDDTALWRNRRVQSYLVLRNAMRDDTITLADTMLPDRIEWAEFEAQLCSIRSKPANERIEDLVTKEELKREGVKSPDMADSLAMQFATSAPRYQIGRGADMEITPIESTLLRNL